MADNDLTGLNATGGTITFGSKDKTTYDIPADYIFDGDDESLGATTAAAATAGSTGTVQAKLRLMTSQLDAIQTAVELIDNAISGTEMQVDLVSAAVTNAGTFVVQEDGAALTALQLIDNIVQTEDSVHTTADSGVMALFVRQDTQADFGADGDYVPGSIDGDGALRVNVVTGSTAGTEYTLGTATYAEATSVGTIAAAVRNDTLATLVNTDNEVGPLQVDASGALWSIVSDIHDGAGASVMNTTDNAVQVDVVAGAALGTDYNEDDLTPATISAPSLMMERTDALTTVTPPEGDWIGVRGTAEGALWTQDFNSDAALTALQLIDNIVQTEDAVHTTGDNGVMALFVRQDVQADFGADGDYVPGSIDADGLLRVNVVTGSTAGTEYTLGTATYAEATSVGTIAAAVRNDTLATLVNTDNEMAPLQVDASGALWSIISDIQDGNGASVMNTTDNAIQVDVVAGTALGTDYNEDDPTPATISGPTVMMERTDALSAVTPIAGDWIAARGTSRGALWTAIDDIEDGAGTSVMDAVNNAIQVNVVAGGAAGGTSTTDDSAFSIGSGAGTPAMGYYNATPDNVDSGDVGVLGMSIDRRLWTDTQIVGQDADVSVSNAGTFATQIDGDALTALQLIDNIVKTEDSAHMTADAGVMALFVRQDTQVDFGADGDYVPGSIDAAGALRVNVVAGGGTGGTSDTDDSAFTAGVGSGTPAMGFFSTDVVDSGDVGVLAMDASRRLLVSIEADNVGIGGGTQYTEDAVAPADPVGGAVLLVRDDAPVSIAADADWVAQRATAYGSAYVQVVDSSGNFIDTFGGGTQYAEDTVHNTGDTGTMSLFVRNDVLAALAGTDGDYAPGQVNASGALYVDGSGSTQPVSGTVTANLSATDNGVLDSIDAAVNGTLTVGSHAVTNAGTFAVQPDGVAAEAAALGNGILIQGDDGTDRKNINVDATTGDVQVDVTNTVTVGAHDVTNAGTFAVQVDGSALTSLSLIDNSISNHGAAVVAGTNQVGLAGYSTDPAVVDSGDTVRHLASLLGKGVVLPFAQPGATWSYTSTAAVADTADDVAKTAGGAGVRHYVTSVAVTNSDATVGTAVVVKSATTELLRQYVAEDGGGFTAHFNPPLRGGANEAINVANITTSAETYFTLTGYTAAE